MTLERYYTVPAYACNDIARVRKGPQDIIGYNVRDRETGIVEIPCDTQQEAENEAARLNAESKKIRFPKAHLTASSIDSAVRKMKRERS